MTNYQMVILPRLAQNGIWVKFYHFWPKNDVEKWSRKTFLKLLHAEAIFYQFILLHRNEAFSTKLQIH